MKSIVPPLNRPRPLISSVALVVSKLSALLASTGLAPSTAPTEVFVDAAVKVYLRALINKLGLCCRVRAAAVAAV